MPIVTVRYSELSSPFMAVLHPTVDLMPLKPNDRFVAIVSVQESNLTDGNEPSAVIAIVLALQLYFAFLIMKLVSKLTSGTSAYLMILILL